MAEQFQTSVKTEELKDHQFSRIAYADLFEDVEVACDFYIRQGTNKFLKIFAKGEKPSKEKLDPKDPKSHIYFLKNNRLTFTNHQIQVAQRKLKLNTKESPRIVFLLRVAFEKYFEEIKESELKPNLVESGKFLWQSLFEAVIQDNGLKKHLNDPEKFKINNFSHEYLTSLFSALICKDIDWVGTKTLQTLALGTLFHDIGIRKLPPEIQETDVALLTEDQYKTYQTHPALGVELLKTLSGIDNSVFLILLQHHEKINGTGYPSGLAGSKIYPLAKVVSLADAFSYFLKENDLTPLEGLKLFIQDQDNRAWYDLILMESLMKALR